MGFSPVPKHDVTTWASHLSCTTHIFPMASFSHVEIAPPNAITGAKHAKNRNEIAASDLRVRPSRQSEKYSGAFRPTSSRSPRSQNLYRLEDAFGSINPASDNVLALLEEAERLRHGKRPHNPQAGAAKRSKAPGA